MAVATVVMNVRTSGVIRGPTDQNAHGADAPVSRVGPPSSGAPLEVSPVVSLGSALVLELAGAEAAVFLPSVDKRLRSGRSARLARTGRAARHRGKRQGHEGEL